MKNVIVIGAGILGVSTAYHLSKRGVNVTLIDRQDLGQATAAAAGIICPWLSQRRNKAWYRLAKNGARYYKQLIAELEAEGEAHTGYAKVGALCLHEDLSKLQAMLERAEKRREEAPEIGKLTLLSGDEAKQRFPLLSEGFHVLHVEGAARVDGRKLTEAMQRLAIRYGARYINGQATLLVKQKTIIGVSVNNEHIEAEKVIVCAGAWSNELLHPLGINIHVDYQKAQIIHLKAKEAIAKETASWPVVMPPNDQYMLAFDDGKIVIGATHENDVEGFDTTPTVAGMHDIMQKGLYTASGIASCSFDEVRVGFRPFTANFLPVFGEVEEWSKLFLANGLGSSGLTAGPYVGLQLAKLVMGETLDLPLEDYALQLARK